MLAICRREYVQSTIKLPVLAALMPEAGTV
jgi:hypothetical protein